MTAIGRMGHDQARTSRIVGSGIGNQGTSFYVDPLGESRATQIHPRRPYCIGIDIVAHDLRNRLQTLTLALPRFLDETIPESLILAHPAQHSAIGAGHRGATAGRHPRPFDQQGPRPPLHT